jgi:uncharacterized protein with NRDE domain
MCLLLAAWRVHPRYELAVAANRDEHHARPSEAMHRWPSDNGVLAGRDLSAGGTWLGVDGRGRFAAVTNYHETRTAPAGQPSRGHLVAGYLNGSLCAADWLQDLATRADRFAGFNLLVADEDSLWYASNRSEVFARPLETGIYGLSNHLLDTPWPKTVRARDRLTQWVDSGSQSLAPLRELLLDAQPDAQTDLPWPASSGPFVMGETFGTRSATWMAREPGRLQLGEQNFAPLGRSLGMTQFSVDLMPAFPPAPPIDAIALRFP